MSRVISCLFLAIALPGVSWSEEPEPAPRVFNREMIAKLDPETTRVSLRYGKGLIPALISRCPKLTSLEIEDHHDIDAAELDALRPVVTLRRLSIFGDLGFDDDDFEAIGHLTQLRELRFGLG